MGSTDLVLEAQLLEKENSELFTGDGTVDIRGNPVRRSKTGNWRACLYILGTECSERVAYFGIAFNLVGYLTTKFHEGNVSAARSASTWQGACYLSPLIGAFLADAYWGKYWTIAVFSVIYLIGLCILTLSASAPAFKPTECVDSLCPSATSLQYALLYMGLYLMAFGTGGIKPCISSFGADQFDDTDPREKVAKGSFFNWYFLSIHIGSLFASSVIVWIQENVEWGLGIGISVFFMAVAVASFFSGTPVYRFQRPGGSPLTRIFQVVVASWHKWKLEVPHDSNLLYETSDSHSAIGGSRKLEHTDGLKCLDKAAALSDVELKTRDFSNPWRLCTVTQVEELKTLIRMFPLWATTIGWFIVNLQMATTFVEQGKAMDRTLGSFTFPAASLTFMYVSSAILFVLIYDKILVPVARNFTGKERGFSELQRIGIGLVISILAMVAAALVEIRRLGIAQELGLVHENVAVPLKVFWQIPQYVLVAVSDVFAYIGYLELSYNQSPDAMRSLCAAFLLVMGSIGSYLNSVILTIVTAITTAGGNAGWIPDNLNEGHLDRFFWLLAGLNCLSLLLYMFCAIKYKPKKVS